MRASGYNATQITPPSDTKNRRHASMPNHYHQSYLFSDDTDESESDMSRPRRNPNVLGVLSGGQKRNKRFSKQKLRRKKNAGHDDKQTLLLNIVKSNGGSISGGSAGQRGGNKNVYSVLGHTDVNYYDDCSVSDENSSMGSFMRNISGDGNSDKSSDCGEYVPPPSMLITMSQDYQGDEEEDEDDLLMSPTALLHKYDLNTPSAALQQKNQVDRVSVSVVSGTDSEAELPFDERGRDMRDDDSTTSNKNATYIVSDLHNGTTETVLHRDFQPSDSDCGMSTASMPRYLRRARLQRERGISVDAPKHRHRRSASGTNDMVILKEENSIKVRSTSMPPKSRIEEISSPVSGGSSSMANCISMSEKSSPTRPAYRGRAGFVTNYERQQKQEEEKKRQHGVERNAHTALKNDGVSPKRGASRSSSSASNRSKNSISRKLSLARRQWGLRDSSKARRARSSSSSSSQHSADYAIPIISKATASMSSVTNASLRSSPTGYKSNQGKTKNIKQNRSRSMDVERNNDGNSMQFNFRGGGYVRGRNKAYRSNKNNSGSRSDNYSPPKSTKQSRSRSMDVVAMRRSPGRHNGEEAPGDEEHFYQLAIGEQEFDETFVIDHEINPDEFGHPSCARANAIASLSTSPEEKGFPIGDATQPIVTEMRGGSIEPIPPPPQPPLSPIVPKSLEAAYDKAEFEETRSDDGNDDNNSVQSHMSCATTATAREMRKERLKPKSITQPNIFVPPPQPKEIQPIVQQEQVSTSSPPSPADNFADEEAAKKLSKYLEGNTTGFDDYDECEKIALVPTITTMSSDLDDLENENNSSGGDVTLNPAKNSLDHGAVNHHLYQGNNMGKPGLPPSRSGVGGFFCCCN
eukprot:CAMPEP_0194371242 /NCGR_PEP_ID=MMETSP0174-20130528/19641_1 /TAXON_ID=216777 /ORGANISM="Proboscia alata, Strain PI-D3" /LENGTH=861 /DNA_ID=CAMNT_0039149191 /DNA_START=893 /DNA_END=3478 /DNA_ORIENTATION=-